MLELLINITKLLQGYSDLFLSENALVEDSGQNPHRAIKMDPTKSSKFKSVLGRTFAAP